MTDVDNRLFSTGFIVGIVIKITIGVFTGIKIYENKMIEVETIAQAEDYGKPNVLLQNSKTSE